MKRSREENNSPADTDFKKSNLRDTYGYKPKNKKMKSGATIIPVPSKDIDPKTQENSLCSDLSISQSTLISDTLLNLERALAEQLENIKFCAPVEYVYNPLQYAFNIHAMYVKRYCNTPKKILFLGMNPGPWGMSQTGVPFGEISMVRNWLKISGPVSKPNREHPQRQVLGFDCTRSEISGARLWGLFRELCGEPENFFKHAYVHNYCPIALMNKKGSNITPADLKGESQNLIHSLCDETLVATVKLLKIEIIVGIGKFAEKRAQTIVTESNLGMQVLCIPHPSPRSVNNQNWIGKTKEKLNELGLLSYLTK